MPGQGAPDVPATIQPKALADFLNRFRVWAMDQINVRIAANEGTQQIMLMAPGTTRLPAATFALGVDVNGNLTTTVVQHGSGARGAVLTFAVGSNYLPIAGGTVTGALTVSGVTTLDGTHLNPLPTNAANDAAAATAGVPVNGVYRNGSILMVRVA
jgi:hypothetical protein